MQTRLPRRVLLYGCLSRGPRVKGTRARDIPRAPRACPIIVSPSTRQALTLTQGAARTLTTWPRMQCSWESEQYKNGSGGMVPLYAVRVQDLGPDDVAVFKCGACGHTAELPPSALLRGLGLKPTDKVLDLERRLRCRLCYARDQAVVSIKWKATS